MHQLGQNSGQADADGQGAFPRFDMDVAGAGMHGVQDQEVHERADFDVALGAEGLEIASGLIHDLCQDAPDHLAVHVGQAAVDAVVIKVSRS